MIIEEVLNKNGINYIIKGKDLLIRCLNPEHEDIHPSMRVSTLLGIGYCFSCGKKIDIYKFFGLVKDTNSDKVIQLKNKLNALYKLQVQHYPIGFDLVTAAYRGISVTTLNEFNAFTCEMRGWEGRIWFPILDIYNNIVVFQGRYIASDLRPKYVFSPPHIAPPIFPPFPDTREGSIIVVEGIFDMLKLWDNGIKNVICSFGLSIAIKYNIELNFLKILGINTLIPLFDSDMAGDRAIIDFEKTYKHDFIIRKYNLPHGKDPFMLSTEEITVLKRELNL